MHHGHQKQVVIVVRRQKISAAGIKTIRLPSSHASTKIIGQIKRMSIPDSDRMARWTPPGRRLPNSVCQKVRLMHDGCSNFAPKASGAAPPYLSEVVKSILNKLEISSTTARMYIASAGQCAAKGWLACCSFVIQIPERRGHHSAAIILGVAHRQTLLVTPASGLVVAAPTDLNCRAVYLFRVYPGLSRFITGLFRFILEVSFLVRPYTSTVLVRGFRPVLFRP